MKNKYALHIQLSLILLMLNCIIAFGQTNVLQLNDLLNLNGQVSNNTNYSIEELSRGNVPSIFIKSGNEISTSNNPVRIIVDSESISNLSESNQNWSLVNTIIVQLNDESDLDINLDLRKLDHLTSLEFIYFSCSFSLCPTNECEIAKIKSLFSGVPNSPLTIYYSTEISE